MCRVTREDDDLTGGEAVEAAAAAAAPFPPFFLLGALYRFWDGRIRFVRASPRDSAAVAGVVSSSQDAVARFFFRSDGNGDGGGARLECYEPVSSRGGLVVLRRARESGGLRQAPSDLCVCDPVAGRRFFLPRPGIHDESQVLLFSGGGGGGSHPDRPRPQMIIHIVNLELLRHKVLQVQTFSPEANAWGPVVATHAHLPPSSFIRPAPLVIGGATYWLCVSNASALGCYILALRLDGSSPAGQIELPPRSHLGRVAKPSVEMLLVSPPSPADGTLGLAVARRHEISIWTLSSPSPSPSKDDGAPRWTRRAVVDLARVAESAAPEEMLPPLTADEEVRLECFAESSAAVLFRLYHGCLFELSLTTMEVRFIGYYSKRETSSLCAYDMDPACLINQ